MKLDLKFKENTQRLDLGFGQYQDLTDGGYERGYGEGYENGRAEGLTEGYTNGKADGFTEGKTEGEQIGYANALAKRTDIEITENGEYTPSEDSTGFKSVNVNVQSEGGGGNLDAFIDRTITEVSSDITEIGLYAFTYCTQLAKIDFPNVKNIKSYAFQYCESLASVALPKTQGLGGYAFMSCTALASVDIPNMSSVGNYAFRKCNALTKIDLHRTNNIGTFAFYECTNLETIILRKTDKPCTLSATNAFQYTKIASGEGYIYVPKNLLETYAQSTNWSTYAAQFRAIEDYPDITGG